MSAASRLRAADGRFVRHPGEDPPGHSAPQLGLNSAGVIGGTGATPLSEPFHLYGVTWEPIDAGPWASPIGYSLAAEVIARG